MTDFVNNLSNSIYFVKKKLRKKFIFNFFVNIIRLNGYGYEAYGIGAIHRGETANDLGPCTMRHAPFLQFPHSPPVMRYP